MNTAQRVVKNFLNDAIETKNVDRYQIRKDALVYRGIQSRKVRFESDLSRKEYERKLTRIIELAFAKKNYSRGHEY